MNKYPFPRLKEDIHLKKRVIGGGRGVVYGLRKDGEEIKQSSITKTGMIKKWKVTPVSTTLTSLRQHRHVTFGRSRDDGAVSPSSSTTTDNVRTKKPRRHTTGSSKEAQEDLLIAKHFSNEMNENGGKVVNELGQEIDPSSTLGRKQLIGMLKQRYGQDIENYRSSIPPGEKERMKRERQMERDRRHEQRMKHGLENEEVDHRYIKPATNQVVITTNGHRRRGSGGSAASATSEGSESSALGTSPQVRRMTSVTSHSSRHQSSDDEQSGYSSDHHRMNGFNQQQQIRSSFNQGSTEQRRQPAKEVVFLQFRDEMRRVNLPLTVSSLDAIKVLFMNAFPGQISMPDFEAEEKSIYIKDHETGVFFQLDDVRDVLNRSFLKIHEKNKPQQHEDDIHSFSESECNDLEKYHTTARNNNNKHNYAESLQDADLQSPRMRRTNSGSSIRSDNVFGRPSQGIHNASTSSYTYISEDGSQQNNTTPQKKLTKQRSGSDSSSSVQDQLDDLTELLKTALNDDTPLPQQQQVVTPPRAQYGDAKNPGKLNPNFIDDLQGKMETSAKKQQVLPKHFQPTIIVKAQQEAVNRTAITRKTSTSTSESESPSYKQQQQQQQQPNHQKLRSKSVKVTVRSNVSRDERPRTKDDIDVLGEQKIKPNVSEEFFTPPNKQSYFEYKSPTASQPKPSPFKTTTTTTTTMDNNNTMELDMSELDDLMNYDPNPQPNNKNSVGTKEVASNLLDQLQSLEDEMKETFSSVENSRRNSNSSMTSKSSALYATVQKRTPTTSVSSVPETPPSPRKTQQQQHVTFDPHHEAEAEIAKLRAMTFNNSQQQQQPRQRQPSSTSDQQRQQRHPSTSSSDQHDGVFTSSTRSSTSSTGKSQPTRKLCDRPSVTSPDFVELETAANSVRENLTELRRDLSTLRKMHVDNTRSFKNDMQKKLLEFRKKASKVDDALQNRIDRKNSNIFGNDHPVREQRHRLSNDQTDYNKKLSSAEYRLQSLEGTMEEVRLDVVNKKRVENPKKLHDFEDEIILLSRNLADTKNKYVGISETLNRVTEQESEIIEKEKEFLNAEPKKLDSLNERCKTLSATLQTLQKLAKMQNEVKKHQSTNHKAQHQSHDYQEISDVNHNMQKGVRFHR